MSTTQQNGPMDNRTFSDGDISSTQQNGPMDNISVFDEDLGTTQQNGPTVYKTSVGKM